MIFLLDSEIKKVIKYKKELESKFNLKVSFQKNYVSIDGDAVDEYMAESVVKAIAVGFDIRIAMLLSDSDFLLEEINIRSYATGKRLQQVKARIIGTKGKALKTLMQLTDCSIVLHENKVEIIGLTENVKLAIQSLQSIIRGSKHGNVYARLERLMAKPEPKDLGLREFKMPKKKIKNKKAL